MSNQNIFKASKEGNFERVKYLIEIEKVDVNSKNNLALGVRIEHIFILLFFS